MFPSLLFFFLLLVGTVHLDDVSSPSKKAYAFQNSLNKAILARDPDAFKHLIDYSFTFEQCGTAAPWKRDAFIATLISRGQRGHVGYTREDDDYIYYRVRYGDVSWMHIISRIDYQMHPRRLHFAKGMSCP